MEWCLLVLMLSVVFTLRLTAGIVWLLSSPCVCPFISCASPPPRPIALRCPRNHPATLQHHSLPLCNSVLHCQWSHHQLVQRWCTPGRECGLALATDVLRESGGQRAPGSTGSSTGRQLLLHGQRLSRHCEKQNSLSDTNRYIWRLVAQPY